MEKKIDKKGHNIKPLGFAFGYLDIII